MRKVFCLTLVLFSMCACLHRGPRLIPPKDMSGIYAELLILDQWIRAENYHWVADTSRVYAPVLEKHGYTPDDFNHSVEHYLQRPGEFSDIFDKANNIIKKRLADYERREKLMNMLTARQKIREQYNLPVPENYYAADSFPSDAISRPWKDSLLRPVVLLTGEERP